MEKLKEYYKDTVIPKLIKAFDYKNSHQVPKVVKIQISAALGLDAQNKTFLQNAIEEFRAISGQQPILTRAKKSIAGFKIREGMPLGLMVTLRNDKMYAFFEKLSKLALPRIRDFRGLNPNAFDLNGNYNLGISDQLIFPEANFDKVDKKRGFTINFVTTAKTNKESIFLLSSLGLPFKKSKL